MEAKRKDVNSCIHTHKNDIALDDERKKKKMRQASEHKKILKRNQFFWHQERGLKGRERERRGGFCCEARQRRRREDRTVRQEDNRPYGHKHQVRHPRHRAALLCSFLTLQQSELSNILERVICTAQFLPRTTMKGRKVQGSDNWGKREVLPKSHSPQSIGGRGWNKRLAVYSKMTTRRRRLLLPLRHVPSLFVTYMSLFWFFSSSTRQ